MAGNWFSWRKIRATEAARVFRFGLVGGTTCVIYFALQFLLAWLGLGPYIALTIAYAIAIAYHFSMNRHFTFRSSDKDGGILATLPRYASIVIFNYFVTVIIVKTVTSIGSAIQIGMLAAIVSTTILTYIISKTWVFKSFKGNV